MSRNNDYKKGKVVDATTLIPEYTKTDILEGISDNILNRFFTKRDFEKVNGYIGREKQNSVLNKIPEDRDFLDENQLQPVLKNTAGNESDFVTFEQFMRMLSSEGIDIDDFEQWGKELNFNFYPPIDIDKIINFQDYYWTDQNTSPEYITIKNEKNRANARYEELLRSALNIVQNVTTSESINDIANNEDDGLFIVFDTNKNTRTLIKKEGTNITKLEDGTTPNFSGLFEYVKLDFPIASITDNIVSVNGTQLQDLPQGYVISMYSTETGVQELATIEETEFDPTTNITTITLSEDVSDTSYAKISIHPTITVTLQEYLYFKDISQIANFNQVDVFNAGQAIWFQRKEILAGTGDVNNLASNYITVTTPDLTTVLSSGIDYKILIQDGPNAGIYNIDSFTSNTIFLYADVNLFDVQNLEFVIFKENTLEQNNIPEENDFWYDGFNDILKQYVQGSWEDKIKEFSIIFDSLVATFNPPENDWSKSNHWAHKNQLSTLSLSRQASMPIIEYESFLELTDFSSFSYNWEYSPSIGDSHIESNENPNLFEISNIELDSNELEYVGPNKFRFPERYGNMVPHIKPGDKIVFAGFVNNSGTYTVDRIEFIKPGPTQRYVTEVTITGSFVELSDSPAGALIYPELTSKGDQYDPNHDHWIFNGVKEIAASSVDKEINPMLFETTEAYIATNSDGDQYKSIVGLSFQEFNPTDEYSGLRLEFDSSLHDLCLFEDFQEGDLRVYINGERIFDKFNEGSIDGVYTTHIVLDEAIVTGPDDRIRVELGEYFKEDIGKRDVGLLTDYGVDNYNIADDRKIEQRKTRLAQYPLFRIYDIFGNSLKESNPIFWFKESGDAPINRYVSKRVETKRNQTDYIFEHGLMGKDGRLLCYKDLSDGQIKSIWHRGKNNEQYVPQKIGDDWDIPNPWFYNIEHDLKKEVSLVDVFRHFRTIELSQDDPMIIGDPQNIFHSLENPNKGIGGTIKEHNGNWDLLISALSSGDTSINDVIDFAGNQYGNILFSLEKRTLDKLAEILEDSVDANDMVNYIRNDLRMDRIYGDSTSYFEGIGIKNIIATSSVLRLTDFHEPQLYRVLDTWSILHHDGHRSSVNFTEEEKLVAFKKLTDNNQKISSYSDPFPDTSDFSEGDFLIRGNTVKKTIKLYVLENGSWEFVDVEKILADFILMIENSLYEVCVKISETIEKQYDIDSVISHDRFFELEKKSFLNYFKGDSALENEIFDSADAFTWNYAYTFVNNNPVVGEGPTESKGSWQALYEKLFKTPYPHEEPWKMQGYKDKPEWWDNSYININPSLPVKWNRSMWGNILSGIIPSGQELPDGTISTGNPGEADFSYLYVPVNITNNTVGTVEPDQIIPPYWDGALSPNPNFKPVFDKSSQEFIKTPSVGFLFGQNGHKEWEWRNSVDYLYSRIKIAYQLDPIRFFSESYGNQLQSVDCLLVDKKTQQVGSHQDTVFHGEVTEDRSTHISHGLQQWIVNYNRYKDQDGSSSLYRVLWREWEPRLSHLFNTFINDKTLRIQGDTIDITDKDFSVDILKDDTLKRRAFSSIKSSVRKIPTRVTSNVYESKDWVFELEFQKPRRIKELETFHPQNYEFRELSGSRFAISSYEIQDADISNTRGFWRASYNEPLSLDTVSNLTSQYQAVVEIDGQIFSFISITGDPQNPPTIREIIESINSQLSGVNVVLESGSIVFKSENIDPNVSSIELSSDTLFPTIKSGFTSDSGVSSLEFNKNFVLKGNQSKHFKNGDTVEIQNSQNFNGEYTIDSVYFSKDDSTTIIRVQEDVQISSNVVDGIMIPENAVTLPWETGQEVYLDSDGILPGSLDKNKPYFVIKLDDFTFQLANTQSKANENEPMENLSTGAGCFWVGNLLRTFKPLGGDPDAAFRHYEPDTRKVYEYSGSITISRIQSLVDFILGYNDYLESIGIISENSRQDNVDEETGRANSWQVEIEKYISWANKLLIKNADFTPFIEAQVDINSNSFVPSSQVIFGTGDRISLDENPNNEGTIPEELKSPFNSFIPYYVIITNSGNIQLAFTKRDAMNGNNISFNSGSGTIVISTFRKNKKFPHRVLNPYKIQFSVEHEKGLLESYIDSNSPSIFQQHSLYDTDLRLLNLEDAALYRKDMKSKVIIVEDSEKNFGGGNIALFEVSHICNFDPYTTGDKLIYDPFLGIKTPRVLVEYLRPKKKTGRPSVGGLVLNNGSLQDSIEKSIEDIRYYYDPYKSIESDKTSIEAKNSVGYQGPDQFMLDLGVDEKSQFIYWKSFIQNKGTNKSLNAFTGHRLLENVTIDEFWAYRLCEFGDSERKAYPEIKLKTDDVVKKELRLEFTPPTGGVIAASAVPIRLNDPERWRNQPDVIELMEPYNGYFFDAKEVEVIENAENIADFTPFQRGTGYKSILLSKPAYGAIVKYTINGVDKNASEGIDFRFLNSRVLEFIADDFNLWNNVTVVTLSYAYEEENPLRLIETNKPEKILKEIPIWNPALDHHNPLGQYPIDIERPDDPAKYTDDLNEDRLSDNHWNEKEVGKVWLDTSRRFYKPYYDEDIFLTEEERSLKWGQLEDFGDAKLYKWIQTDLSPEEYIEKVEEDENRRIQLSEKATGSPRRLVYKNIGTSAQPIWEEETVKVIKFPVAGYDENSDTSDLVSGETLDMYINGEFLREIQYSTPVNLVATIDSEINNGNIEQKDILTLVKEPHEPTEEELENQDYTIVYPHTKIRRFNKNSLEEEYLYFYWVTDMRSEKLLQNASLTLFDAERQYKRMTEPFAIIHGFRDEGTGYGVLFGSTFDPEENLLPTRFSLCTIKGLNRTVKDDSNYILRLTKDYTLRDRMNEKNLKLSNKHWSWKLIRKNQSSKIDILLWKKVIEAATERVVLNDDFDLDADEILPSESRIRFDTLVDGAASRIGLYDGRVLMDKSEIIDLTMEILFDPSREWERVDIEKFVNEFDLDRIEGIKEFYRSIYETFTPLEINDIFFELLERSMALNKQHPDIFKTSWVSVDVSNRVSTDEGEEDEVVEVFPSDFECGDDRIILPSPTPPPSPEPSVSPSVTPSLTPSPTPSITPTPSASEIAPVTVDTLVTFGSNDISNGVTGTRLSGIYGSSTLGSSPYVEHPVFDNYRIMEKPLPVPLINQNIPSEVIPNLDTQAGPWKWVNNGWWITMAIKEDDGSLYGWGWSTFFMLGKNVGDGNSSWATPIKLFEGTDVETGWEKIEFGGFMSFTAGIRDGGVYVWSHHDEFPHSFNQNNGGDPNYYWPSVFGQGPDITGIDVQTPTQIMVGANSENLQTGWTDLSVNEFALHGINNGRLYTWSEQFYTGFSLEWKDMDVDLADGRGDPTPQITRPSQIGTKDDWVFVQAGIDYQHLYAIDSQGRLYGQTVDFVIIGVTESDLIAAGLDPLIHDDVTRLDIPLDKGGLIQIGVGTDYEFGWQQVSSNLDNSLGIRNGKLYYWGEGGPSSGMGESNDYTPVLTPTQIGAHDDWTWVKVGWGDAVYAIRNGTLYVWGAEVKVSDIDTQNVQTNGVWEPTIPADSGTGWKKAWHAYDYGSFAVSSGIVSKERTIISSEPDTRTDGIAYVWGRRDTGLFTWQIFSAGVHPSNMNNPAPMELYNVYDPIDNIIKNRHKDWDKITSSQLHSIALRDSKLYVWGNSQLGQNGLLGYINDPSLNNKTLTSVFMPTKLNLLDESLIAGWEDISCGSLHSLGINSGKLYAWGYSKAGRLGLDVNGGLPSFAAGNIYETPTQVGVGTNYENGWQKIYTTPTKVTGVIISMSTTDHDDMSDETNFGINSGKLYSWGSNIHGMTGLNTNIEFTEFPTQVGALENWQSIAATETGVVGIESGRLYVWGDNSQNQLGINQPGTVEVLVPTQITPHQDWVKVSASNVHMTALRANGELYTWGVNEYGVADRSSADNSIIPSPTIETTHNDWEDIYAGQGWNIGRRTGRLYAWGLFPRDYRMISNQKSSLLRDFTELSEHDWKDFVTVRQSDIANIDMVGHLNIALKETPVNIVEDS